MKLVVGLGNPGGEHLHTRHNLGFLSVEHFFKSFSSVDNGSWSLEKKFKSEVAVIDYQPLKGKKVKVILAKPQTYMNLSGMAVSLIKEFYKIDSDDIWVAHDDLDLPVGNFKIRLGGAAGGHHGVESIIEHLGTDKFYRFKMGIGTPIEKKIDSDGEIHMKKTKNWSRAKVEDYVLAKFEPHDESKIKHVLKTCSQAFEIALEKDITAAQNRYNTK